jgi:hypothetical protein
MAVYPTAVQDRGKDNEARRTLLLQAITSGDPGAFNAWRASNPGQLIIIKEQNFENLKFKGYDLRNVVFMNTSFLSCEFVECNISGASFGDCDWNLATFSNCAMIGSITKAIEAHKVTFSECRMMGCDMRGAILDFAKISHSDLEGVFLNHSNLSRGSVVKCNLSNVHLANANLSETKFEQTNLYCVDFRSSNFTESMLASCNLSEAMLWNVQIGGWSLRNITCSTASFDEEGHRKIRFLPNQFERLYGGDLRVNLAFDGGIIISDLLAIPAIIESIKREFPGSEIFVSSIHELGDMTEMTVTAKCLRILDKEEMSSLETLIGKKFATIIEYLHSNDKQLACVNEQLMSNLNQLTELIVKNSKSSITFTGQVIAGVIGNDTSVSGTLNVDSHAISGATIKKEDLIKLIDALDRFSKDLKGINKIEVINILKKIKAEKHSKSLIILKETGKTLRNICEGAMGSIAASDILSIITKLGLS